MNSPLTKDLTTAEVTATLAIVLIGLIAIFTIDVSIGILAIFLCGCVCLQIARRTHDPILAGSGGLIFTLAVWLGWARWGVKVVKIAVVDIPDPDFEQLGQLGDLFGGINALFASFAFIGVAVAAYFQYRTMRLVEEDSKLQRNERKRQAFEPLFFTLLGRVSPPTKLRSSFANSIYESPELGKAAITKELGKIIKPHNTVDPWLGTDNTTSSFRHFYSANEAILGPHFRKLYHLFKFIHRSELTDDQKRDYATIARAALDKDDLALLVANTYTDEGKFFIPLIEYYGILKHGRHSHECKRLAEINGIRECAFQGASGRTKFWEQHPDIKSELERKLEHI